MNISEFGAKVIESGVGEIARRELPLYTFALYYDHESNALSVCADTKENSNNTVRRINAYNVRHFRRAVLDGDLAMAKLWQANIGRSLSLGDFALVNAGRQQANVPALDETHFVELLRTLLAYESRLRALAPQPDELLLACSGVAEEVALVWATQGDA